MSTEPLNNRQLQEGEESTKQGHTNNPAHWVTRTSLTQFRLIFRTDLWGRYSPMHNLCRIRAGIQRFITLIANSCLESRNPGRIRAGEKQESPLSLPSPEQIFAWAVTRGSWNQWPPGVRVQLSLRDSIILPWKADFKVLFYLSAFLLLPMPYFFSLKWNQNCFSQSSLSHYLGTASLGRRISSAVFVELWCSPLAAPFPSLSKVESSDGNPNYKHMSLLSATTGPASFSFKGQNKME